MTTRELAAGTGFQIALERDGATFVSKLDEDVKFPRLQRNATVGNLRLEPERRLVDQTGIEPVTS